MAIPHHGWTYDNYASEADQRGLDLGTFLRATHQQNQEGLPVTLEVPPLTWGSHKLWDLLMIFTKPLPGFAHRSNMAKTVKLYHEGWRYHISLCFLKELPADGGWEAYERIRQRYHGRRGVLCIKVSNAQAVLQRGVNAFTDELLDDPDVAFLHNAGQYKTRPLHVST